MRSSSPPTSRDTAPPVSHGAPPVRDTGPGAHRGSSPPRHPWRAQPSPERPGPMRLGWPRCEATRGQHARPPPRAGPALGRSWRSCTPRARPGALIARLGVRFRQLGLGQEARSAVRWAWIVRARRPSARSWSGAGNTRGRLGSHGRSPLSECAALKWWTSQACSASSASARLSNGPTLGPPISPRSAVQCPSGVGSTCDARRMVGAPSARRPRHASS
jgi:hypothetical protein